MVRITAKSRLVGLGVAQPNGVLETHSGFGEKTIHMENGEEIRRLCQVISDNDPNSEAVGTKRVGMVDVRESINRFEDSPDRNRHKL